MAKIADVRVPPVVTVAAVQAARAVVDEATRLGLVWRLRPGTVGGSAPASPEGVPVRIDGDTTTVYARSMVGAVAATQRVWCIQVPPAGIYIVGIIGEALNTGGRVKVQRIGNQSINNDSNTTATFTVSLWDSHGFWNGSGTFTVPDHLGGLYSVIANGCFASNATGSRAINILQNGNRMSSVYVDTHSATAWREDNATHLELAPGDTVQMQVFQNSGAALNFTGSTTNISTFSMVRVQV